MAIQEVDAAQFDAEYFTDINRVLEVGIGNSDLSAITPTLNPELFVATDVLNCTLTPYAADLGNNVLMHWETMSKPDKRIVRLYADGTQLPFRDGTFDAVFAANVFGDPSVGPYEKSCIITEAIRVLDTKKAHLGASALWLVEYNTPIFARRFLSNWLESPQSSGYSIKKAVIPPRHDVWNDRFDSRNYPLNAGDGGICEIYTIKPTTPTEKQD